MKFTFDVPELQKRLSQVSSVIKRKSPEPVYAHVRLFSDADGVKLQGIDIDTTLTVKLPGASADGPANILLDFAVLNGVAQQVKTKQAFISYDDEAAAIFANGAKFKGKLTGYPTAKFTELPVVLAIGEKPELGGYPVGLPGLKEQIEQVEFSVPKPDGKFVVPSALLESTTDTLRLVATDGVVLAISSIPANLGEFKFTLPKPALELIKKLDGGPTVTISETEGVFYFSTELETLTYSKTHSEFPAYYRVIPKPGSFPTSILLKDKDAFYTALKQTKNFTSGEKKGIRFSVEENGTSITFKAIREEKLATGDIYETMADDEIDATVVGSVNALRLDVELFEPFIEKAVFPLTIFVKSESAVCDMHSNGGTQEKPTYRFLIMPMRGGASDPTSTPVEVKK